MNLNKRNVRTILLIITFTVVLSWLFRNLHLLPDTVGVIVGYLTPFLLGCGIAYILNLPTRFFERVLFGKPWKKKDHIRRKVKRPISLLLSFLIILGAIVSLFVILIPELINTITVLSNSIPNSFDRAQRWFDRTLSADSAFSQTLIRFGIDLDEIAGNIVVWLNGLVTDIVNATVAFSMSLFSFVFNLFLAIVFSFYIVSQKERLGNQGYRIIYAIFPPLWADRFRRFIKLANRSFSNFLSGQVVEAIIFGCLITTALAIFKFPYTILVGVLSGCFALIPVLGAWVSAIIGALLMLTIKPSTAFTFLIIFLIIQQIEGNLIYPFVVGKRVGLAPIWVLAAVVLGGALGGILGAFISIPVFSIIYELVSKLIDRRLKNRPIHANQLLVSSQIAAEHHSKSSSFINRIRFFIMRRKKMHHEKKKNDSETADDPDKQNDN
ncbi:MAG: AI-2E family transporter [Fastidiosipilaceae bacterium]|nr:AI-2E family transporter [Clostridiaceae bacterium]